MRSFTVLAISQDDYKEQVNLSDSYVNFMEDDTDYTILISSKHFKKFIKEETNSPLSIMVYVALNELEQTCEQEQIHIKDDLLHIKDDLQQIVCGSIGILDDNILGDDYIVMPNEYFKKLQIFLFFLLNVSKIINIFHSFYHLVLNNLF